MSERILVTDFEVWLRTVCFQAPPANCYDLAETAWLHQQDRITALSTEVEILKRGMKGDYDLDAWLDWVYEAEALRIAASRVPFLQAELAAMESDVARLESENKRISTLEKEKCFTHPANVLALMERNVLLEKVAETAEVEYREQYSYGHTSKDTMDALFDALDAAGYLGEGK